MHKLVFLLDNIFFLNQRDLYYLNKNWNKIISFLSSFIIVSCLFLLSIIFIGVYDLYLRNKTSPKLLQVRQRTQSTMLRYIFINSVLPRIKTRWKFLKLLLLFRIRQLHSKLLLYTIKDIYILAQVTKLDCFGQVLFSIHMH